MNKLWAKYDLTLIDKITSEFEKRGNLTIEERCNCAGNNIQHNTGNNWHRIFSFVFKDGTYYIFSYDTRISSWKHARWRQIEKQELSKIMRAYILEGFWYRFEIEYGSSHTKISHRTRSLRVSSSYR